MKVQDLTVKLNLETDLDGEKVDIDHIRDLLAALREVQEREKGCEYCNDYEDLPEHIINGKPVGKVFDTSITCDENGRWHIELPSGNDIGISICPYCGRRLTEGREDAKQPQGLDYWMKQPAETEGDGMSKAVREFLVDIAENEIISGKKYSCRIEIEDGGYNSYVALDVDVDDWVHRPCEVTKDVRIFRHTNSASKLANTWCFQLGNVCHLYADEPNIPLEFSSYGKSPDEAEADAEQYFNKLKKLIRKQTSVYKVEAAKSAQEEKEKLLERLKELEATL